MCFYKVVRNTVICTRKHATLIDIPPSLYFIDIYIVTKLEAPGLELFMILMREYPDDYSSTRANYMYSYKQYAFNSMCACAQAISL